MKMVILAAGKGTRMMPFSQVLPKALMPVGGRPAISRIIEKWKHVANTAIICINSNDMELFENYLTDVPMNVDFSVSAAPLGTAGEVLNAEDKIGNEDFIMHYGDIITDIETKFLVNTHKEYSESLGTDYIGILVLNRETIENSVVDSYMGRVLKFEEKPISPYLTWGAIAVFRPPIFDYLKIGKDFGKDVFPKIIEDGKILAAFYSSGKWYDIGNVRSWEIADKAARNGEI